MDVSNNDTSTRDDTYELNFYFKNDISMYKDAITSYLVGKCDGKGSGFADRLKLNFDHYMPINLAKEIQQSLKVSKKGTFSELSDNNKVLTIYGERILNNDIVELLDYRMKDLLQVFEALKDKLVKASTIEYVKLTYIYKRDGKFLTDLREVL